MYCSLIRKVKIIEISSRKPMATSTYYRKHAASRVMATIVGAAILLSTVDAQTTSQPPVPTAGPVDPGIAAVQTLQQTLSQILSQIAGLLRKSLKTYRDFFAYTIFLKNMYFRIEFKICRLSNDH